MFPGVSRSLFGNILEEKKNEKITLYTQLQIQQFMMLSSEHHTYSGTFLNYKVH